MFSVTIRFSGNPDTDTTREFDTEAERLAFLDGIDAACGWMDYEIEEATPA